MPGRKLRLSWGRASQPPPVYSAQLLICIGSTDNPAGREGAQAACAGWGQVGTCQTEAPREPVSTSQFSFLDVHIHPGGLPPTGFPPSPTALLMTQREGKKNPSTLHKQLISLLGCLGSSNVIIILTKALASVRGISTTAADTIIKAPAFLCSKSCTERLSRDLLWRETPRLGCFSCFLPFLLPSFPGPSESPACSWKQS